MTDLRTRIIEAIAKADQDWCSDNPLHEDIADAVIRELGLRIEYGALDPTDSGRLSDDDDLVPLRGEVLKTRYITDWTEHG